jgi:hypothetical protein
MLRVRIELVPDGDEEAVKLLAAVDISNDGSGTEATGHYSAVLKEAWRGAGDPQAICTTEAKIHDVDREIIRPVQLVSIALQVLAPIKRTTATSLFSWGEIVRGPE